MNKISIIIPHYNNYPTLKKCIDSINKSKIKNYEIIIVDDCSTEPLIKKYYLAIQKKKIRIFFNEINKGPSYSRNKGAANAKGNILLFLDSDCYVFPDTLKKIDDFFKYNKKISCLGGTYTIKSPSKNFFSNFQTLIGNYFELKKKKYFFWDPIVLQLRKSYLKKLMDFLLENILVINQM